MGNVGQHRLAGGHAGRIEDGAERGEREEQPEREDAELRRNRDGGDAHAAQDVGHDRRSASPEAIDDRAGDEAGEHERECGDRRDEADVGGAAGELEHDPWERDERDAVPCRRDEGRDLERDERTPAPRRPYASCRAHRRSRERRLSFSVRPPV